MTLRTWYEFKVSLRVAQDRDRNHARRTSLTSPRHRFELLELRARVLELEAADREAEDLEPGLFA